MGMWDEYAEVRLESFGDLVEFQESLRTWGPYLYRGQSNAEWELETQVRRNRPEHVMETLHHYERDMLRLFKRHCHLHEPSVCPPEHLTLDWLALIQHHGGATRLLDFSRSVYVAAYFAIGMNSAAEAAAIWAVREFSVSADFCHARYRHEFPEAKILNLEHTREHDLISHGYSHGESLIDLALDEKLGFLGVFHDEPYRMNRRLAVQQGTFLIPTTLKESFLNNIAGMLGKAMAPTDPLPYRNLVPHPFAVMKIHIPRKLFSSFRSCLKEMNITTATMFPDLDGLARWINDIIPAKDEDPPRLIEIPYDRSRVQSSPANPLYDDEPKGS